MGRIKGFIVVMLVCGLGYLVLFSLLVGVVDIINKDATIILLINSLLVGLVGSIVHPIVVKILREK